MEIILLERIEKLGQMGDVVRVKEGFARNYLLPAKKALRATPDNLERFQTDRTQLEAVNLELKKEAESVAGKVEGLAYVAIRQAGDSGQLYGSVTTRDIAKLVTDGGMTITRNQVVLDTPIKAVGLHNVRIALHPEVSVSVIINVARTEDEGERQARGEAVGAEAERLLDEAEIITAEEIFEDEDIAQQAVEELIAEEDTDEDDAADHGAAQETGEAASKDDEQKDSE